MSATRGSRGDFLSLAVLLLVTAIIYHKAWLWGRMFFDDDVALYFAGPYRYAAQQLAKGSLPMWNPYLFGGTPFLADPQTGVFYPPNWIFLIVPVEWGVTLLPIAHLVLGGALMYWFCRAVLGAGSLASAAAGLVFAHGCYLPAHYLHTARVMSAAWMPGIYVAYLLGVKSRRVGWFCGSGLMLGLAFLAGDAQSVYLIGLGLVALAGYETLRLPRRKNTASTALSAGAGRFVFLPSTLLQRLSPIFGLALLLLLALGIGAAQWVPTLSFLPDSPRRSGMPIAGASTFSIPPLQGLIGLVCPHFFGHQATSYWGPWHLHEMALYVGILPLVVASGAAILCRKQPYALFFTLLAVSAFLLAGGMHTFLFRLAYALLPGISFFRAPGRFVLLFGFSIAGLLAIGLQSLTSRDRGRGWRWWLLGALIGGLTLGVVGVRLLTSDEFYVKLIELGMPGPDRDPLLIFIRINELARSHGSPQAYFTRLLVLTGLILATSLTALVLLSKRRAGWPAAVVVLTVLSADLVQFNRGLNPWARAGSGLHYLKTPDWATFLQRSIGSSRCRLASSLRPSNTEMLVDLPTDGGYAAFLPTRRYLELAAERDRLGADERWRRLFGVAYVALPRSEPGLGEVVFRSAEEAVNVYRDRGRVPRAHVVFDAEWVPDPQEALRRVFEPDFDPARKVVVEAPPPSNAQKGSGVTQEDGEIQTATVTFLEDGPERIRLAVESPRPGMLVLADAYHPCWRARVNDRPAVVFPANYYFRALSIPAGRSHVELRYVNPLLWGGFALSLASGMGILLYLTIAGSRPARQ